MWSPAARELARLALAALLGLGAPPSLARCSLSAQDIVFGGYDASSPNAGSLISELTLNCATPANISIQIGPSRTSGSTGDRRMRHRTRADTLGYNLFLDASRTRLWGDGARGAPLDMRVERQATVRLYGEIPAGQQVWVGEYEDTVTVTVLP